MRRIVFTALNVFLIFGTGAFGQDLHPTTGEISGRETLRGIKQFAVKVGVNGYAQQAGIAARQIQTDVELRLRSLGIPVVSDEEASKLPEHPLLGVSIVAIGKLSKCSCGPDTLTIAKYSYVVRLTFHENAVLLQDALRLREGYDAQPILLETLGLLHVGDAEKEKVLSEVRGVVSDMVDTFANNYLAENPK